MNHLEEHNLLRQSQHGFMAGKSTLSNLLEYLDELTKLVDQGHSVDIVYLDFAKTFDKVPHTRLIKKCEGLWIRGRVLKWIQCWLSDRKQRVLLNGQWAMLYLETGGIWCSLGLSFRPKSISNIHQ